MNDRKPPENEVTEASEESFPASDPPAFTGARAGGPAEAADPPAPVPRNGEGRARARPALWILLLAGAALLIWWAAS